MPRFSFRNHVGSLERSDKGTKNTAVSPSRKNNCKKRKTQKKSNICSRNLSPGRDVLNSTTCTNRPHSPSLSMICSLPLHKISGFLEKIISPTDKFLYKGKGKYEPKQSSNNLKNSEQITESCIKILCLYCDKKFSSQFIQEKHVEKTHKLYKTRRFSNRNANLQSTESKRSIDSSNPTLQYYSGCFFCKNRKEQVGTPTNDFTGLFFHMVDFHSEKYFGCKLCILRFQNPGNLAKHMSSAHKNTSFVVYENWKLKEDARSDIIKDSKIIKFRNQGHQKLRCTPTQLQSVKLCKLGCTNVVKEDARSDIIKDSKIIKFRNQGHQKLRCTPTQLQSVKLCKIGCTNVVKNSAFGGDEPILSRLGIAQNRLPSNRKNIKQSRDGVKADVLLKPEFSASTSKIRNRVAKTVSNGDTSDAVFRSSNRSDMLCLIENNFYLNVVSNVRNNVLYYLDGKVIENTSQLYLFNSVSQHYYVESEIHKATEISTLTAFPTLLTPEQYGIDVLSTKLKRPVTKHSWKWKWDSFRKFKFVNEGKIIKKIKQPLLNLRDLSKLDMWTQLTMRQKTYNPNVATFSDNDFLPMEKKLKLNDQLNNILDARILPQIILEQNEQTIVKLECINITHTETELGILSIRNKSMEIESKSMEIEDFCALFRLLPSNVNSFDKPQLILSGEWARPRCYLCTGCGLKFEKLKSLEEHKMFRHSHVYSTHYEIVGRELMSCNLLRHFFIPKRAFARYDSTLGQSQIYIINNTLIKDKSDVLPKGNCCNSVHLKLGHSTKAHFDKNNFHGCDTDLIMTMHKRNISSLSDSIDSLQLRLNKEIVSCTKCKKKCSGVYDLYRHMLDCSGDYIWIMAKKRKYRYYCGSKKRRQSNKTCNTVLKKKKLKSFKNRRKGAEMNSNLLKAKVSPKQRPSDAESIKKMIENLPPKRVCKKVLPTFNKVRKSRLMAKRKLFNSQGVKQKLSSRIKQNSNVLYEVKRKMIGSTLNANLKYLDGTDKKCSKYKIKDSLQKAFGCFNAQTNPQNIRTTAETSEQGIKSITQLTCSSSSKENSVCLSKINNIIEELTHISENPRLFSIGGCNNAEYLKISHLPVMGKLPLNFEHTNCKKKRSKKINDCIAMLTGKLEEKLKTEEFIDCGTETNSIDNKVYSVSTSKATKRKTCSRKIVKLDFDILNNEICDKYVLEDNQIVEKGKQQSSTANKVLAQSYNQLIPCEEKREGDFERNTPDDLVLISETPTVLIDDYSPTLSGLSLIEYHNTLSTKPHMQQFPSRINTGTVLARRQTIVGDEGINNTDDVKPLDLSTKTKFHWKKNTSEANISSDNIRQTFSSGPLISSILHNKQIDSKLELINLPQVESPHCSDIINEKCYQMINSKRKKNKSADNYSNRNPAPTYLNNSYLDTKEPVLNKKFNSVRTRNSSTMNEIIICHINEAIDSVISAENINSKLESIQDCMRQDTSNGFTERNKNNELRTNVSINEIHANQLLPSKCGIRSKSLGSSSYFTSTVTQASNSMRHEQLDTVVTSNSDKEMLSSSDLFSPNKFIVVEKIADIEEPKRQTVITEKVPKSSKNKMCDTVKSIKINIPVENFNSPKENITKNNELQPIKKQRRRRKNELAAIVADQLLESFKIDKAQRTNLKKLEILANEKTKDLLTGMFLLSSTKRIASIFPQNSGVNGEVVHNNTGSSKYGKQNKCAKYTKNNVKDITLLKEIKEDLSTKTSEVKEMRKKQFSSQETENINKLGTCSESFTLNSVTQVTYSRDPRLNKNIHHEENLSKLQCSLPIHLLRSSSNNKNNLERKAEDILNREDDSYLNEIARSVNENIMVSDNGDFKIVNDEFELESMSVKNSVSKIRRLSTSMSVCSAPNVNENRYTLGSANEHTHTELIDMDLDDNLSVYTSLSQDVNRGSKRKRRRRSILLSRKQKKKVCRNAIEANFECLLCKKRFYSASSLTKHQATLAHVSKVSEQEYLLLKAKDKKRQLKNCSYLPEAATTAGKKDIALVEIAKPSENDKKGAKCTVKSDFRTLSLSLNSDEKLFFECCNILKGSQTGKTIYEDPSNCTIYTYLEKNQAQPFSSYKINETLSSYGCKKPAMDISSNDITSHSTQGLLQDLFNLKNGDNLTNPDQKNSTFHKSTITYQTSRFKTKAAMKGYENLTDFGENNTSICKLTALAEIALENENSRLQATIEDEACVDFGQNNALECFSRGTNEIYKTANISKEYSCYNNISADNLICRTVTDFSMSNRDTTRQEEKNLFDDIVIPERPFRNIGLEAKELIQFQNAKTNENLLNIDESSVSTTFSDRHGFDFISLSGDENCSIRTYYNGKPDRGTISSSSRISPKTLENKSLIVDRIFKNANAKTNKHTITEGSSAQKNSLPKPDLNVLFDELRERSISKTKILGNCKRDVFQNMFPEDGKKIDKDKQNSNSMQPSLPQNTVKPKTNKSIHTNKKKKSKLSKLQSELGMNTDEIAQLIAEGQRKSKRRAASHPKKLVEMWSSDEYEELLSTEDIFALIEEKERTEKKRKRKSSITTLNSRKNKADQTYDNIKERMPKSNSDAKDSSFRPLEKLKSIQKRKAQTHKTIGLSKKELNIISSSHKTREDRSSVIKNVRKARSRSEQKIRDILNGPNEIKGESADKVVLCKLSKDKIVYKDRRNKNNSKLQTAVSKTRRKRVAPERIYYWSTSSDEDFTNTKEFESREQYQKHGWIVGDSHKKLVTLLAIAKGNKKVENRGVKKQNCKKIN